MNASILDGPMVERTNERARARIPMSAEEARHFRWEATRGRMKDESKIRIIDAALRIGNLSDGAKDVYRAWRNEICAG